MDKPRRPAIHYILPLVSVAVPAALTYFLKLYLKTHHQIAPLVNICWLIPICAGAWWWGYAGGLGLVGLVIVAASLAATGHWIAPQIQAGSIAGLIGISVAVSAVAQARRKVEDLLRSTNEQLDIKVRTRTAELEQARDWLQTTIGSIGDAVATTDAAGRILLMNGVAEALTGWKLDEAVGKPLERIFMAVDEDQRSLFENPVSRVMRTGTVTAQDHAILVTRDGREMPIDDSAAPIRDAEGNLAGVVLIFREIGERYRAEKERERLLREADLARAAAEEQRAQLHSVFMQAPAIINIHAGPDHVFEFVHPLMGKLTGGREIAGLPLREALPEFAGSDQIALLDRVYETGVSEMAIEVPVLRADEAPLYFDWILNCRRNLDGTVAGIIFMAVDVTERVTLRREEEMSQERLREAARLESLGVLAGGIAHDFNNLLVGIMGNASLALELVPKSHQVCGVIEDLQNASEKAALLTRQMLAYSGKGRFVIEPLDLSEVTADILPLISRSVPPNVVVRPLLAKTLPRMEADQSQLHQVIMNLVINAAEACGDKQGIVTVITSVAEPERHTPAAFGLAPVEGGALVALEVSDTGCGMPEEVKAKIFDPFFTTKFTGRGLGLSAVLGIIRAHKGAISVDSAPGKGTTFRVLFPATTEPVVEKPAAPALSPGDLAGSGIVLVVDDEDLVRRVAKLTLEKYGYKVALASNGYSGVEVFRSMPDRILAVVLDLTMPIMGGEEALAEMKRIDPEVRVILSTGYSESEATKRFAGQGLAGFLQKPYTSAQLAGEVKSVVAVSQRPA